MFKKPVIGISVGDAGGVGPEIVCHAAAEGTLEKYGHAVILADERELLRGIQINGRGFEYEVCETIEEAVKADKIALINTKEMNALEVPIGVATVECAAYSGKVMEQLVKWCMAGYLDGICFGPNNKEMLKKAGFVLKGAIDLFAGFMGYTGPKAEFNVTGNVWTSRVTSHIPLASVSTTITTDKILEAIHLLHDSQVKAGFDNPHIAVAALNPHGGEGGTTGTEEITIIRPAVEKAKAEGLNVDGPLPADTLFYNLFRGAYDSAVTMYHDQGQIAMKLNGFNNVVTVNGGLPYPVTTCCHGTAYDIAGKRLVNPGAWAHAYQIACSMGTKR